MMQVDPYSPNDVISVLKAAELIGVNASTVTRSIAAGKLRADETISVYGGGNDGRAYRVYVDSLPIEAQIRYWQESASAELGNGCREMDLVGYRARHGEAGLQELFRRQRAALAAHGLRMKHEECGFRGYNTALAKLADELGILRGTLYRWERRYAELGLMGLARKEREDAGESRSMCLLARDYLEFLMCSSSKPPQNYVLEKLQDAAKSFKVTLYTSDRDNDGEAKEYHSWTFPGCKGSPVSGGMKDGDFSKPKYQIKSRPKGGQSPLRIKRVTDMPAIV